MELKEFLKYIQVNISVPDILIAQAIKDYLKKRPSIKEYFYWLFTGKLLKNNNNIFFNIKEGFPEYYWEVESFNEKNDTKYILYSNGA